MDKKKKKEKKDKLIKEKKEQRTKELLEQYKNDQEKILKELEKLEKLHSEEKLLSANMKTKRKELIELMREKSTDPKWKVTYKAYRKDKKNNFSNIDAERKEAEGIAEEKKRRRIEIEKKKPFLLLCEIPKPKEENENENENENDEEQEEGDGPQIESKSILFKELFNFQLFNLYLLFFYSFQS